jgi:hypothetical protein
MGHSAASPGVYLSDFEDLVAFVQNLERMLNGSSFLDLLEIKQSLGQHKRRSGKGLSEGRSEKSKEKQTT